MPLTSRIGNAEISADPSTGLVLGDVNPATTQAGVMTRYRNADDENSADTAANVAAFNAHTHAGGSGGQPIGTGPVVAIEPNGIDGNALGGGAISSAKIKPGAVTTDKIADATITRAQIGAPVSFPKTVSGSGSVMFAFAGASVTEPPRASIEANHGGEGSGFSVSFVGFSGVTVTYNFAGSVNLICRAFGCTAITA